MRERLPRDTSGSFPRWQVELALGKKHADWNATTLLYDSADQIKDGLALSDITCPNAGCLILFEQMKIDQKT